MGRVFAVGQVDRWSAWSRQGALSRLAVGLLLAVTGLSCGDSSGAGSADAFVSSYCELFNPCCAKANLRSDGQQCRLFLGAFAPAGKYDKQQGEACLSQVKAAAGKPGFCEDSSNQSIDACEKVFAQAGGSKQPGETCDVDSDCAASSEGKAQCASSFGGSAQIRKCQIQVRGKAGDNPCVGTVEGSNTFSNVSLDGVPAKGYLCYDKDNLRCDTTSNSCVAYKAVGEACSGNGFLRDCIASAYCDNGQKKCVAHKAAGAACGDAASSSQYECIEGNYCSMANQCAAQTTDGGACTSDQQCRSNDCVNSMCRPKSGGDLGLMFLCGAK